MSVQFAELVETAVVASRRYPKKSEKNMRKLYFEPMYNIERRAPDIYYMSCKSNICVPEEERQENGINDFIPSFRCQ